MDWVIRISHMDWIIRITHTNWIIRMWVIRISHRNDTTMVETTWSVEMEVEDGNDTIENTERWRKKLGFAALYRHREGGCFLKFKWRIFLSFHLNCWMHKQWWWVYSITHLIAKIMKMIHPKAGQKRELTWKHFQMF